MEHTVRASAIQIGIVGLPYSGKSTLLSSLLNLNGGPGEVIAEMFDNVWSGLSVSDLETGLLISVSGCQLQKIMLFAAH